MPAKPPKRKAVKQLAFGGMATREMLSRRQYARRRGVSEAAVRRAIETGRITVGPGNKIDPIKADRQWNMSTDLSRPLNSVTGNPKHRKGDDDDGPGALADLPARAAADPELAKHATAWAAARAAREQVRAQIDLKELQRLQGTLIDRNKARSAAYSHTRRARDIVLGIRDRIRTALAGIPGVDLVEVDRRVEHELRLACTELARPIFDVPPGEEGKA